MKHIESLFVKLPKRVIRGGFTQPKIFYKGMVDLGHKFELRFWIRDPQKGIGNIKNDVMVFIHRELEEKFTREKLGVKFSIHDDHLRRPSPKFQKKPPPYQRGWL